MTEEEKPLTREDVLKMIEEHGGPEGLDLSKKNLKGIDLSSDEPGEALDLRGIILEGANLQEANLRFINLQGASLLRANLQGADLWGAELQEAKLQYSNLHGAGLWYANLQGASLTLANLQGAFLSHANLQGAFLWGAKLHGTKLWGARLSKASLMRVEISRETMLEGVDWGPKYILHEEEEGRFRAAAEDYCILRRWHTEAGMYDIAGEFYFREMTVRRKDLKWWPNLLPRAWSEVLAILCGYGEKPFRVVISAAVVVFGLAAIYSASALTFLQSLYYSTVSFTALGYGFWVSDPVGWVKGLGAFEASIGVFMMALFLITFVRKMTR